MECNAVAQLGLHIQLPILTCAILWEKVSRDGPQKRLTKRIGRITDTVLFFVHRKAVFLVRLLIMIYILLIGKGNTYIVYLSHLFSGKGISDMKRFADGNTLLRDGKRELADILSSFTVFLIMR